MSDDPNVADTEVNFSDKVMLEESIRKLKVPQGTKESPARTCKELALAKPNLPNGFYWIDPNNHDAEDAFEVYCDFRTRQSCVQPQNQVDKAQWYEGPQKRTWFSEEVTNGFSFTYKASKNQLRFLQLLSSRASQNVTYHCKNSVAYYDQQSQNFNSALSLLTSNEKELGVQQPIKFRYSVSLDECQYRQNKWTRTVFEINTEKPKRLPVIDVAPVDIGDRNQAFGLELGPVCFS